MLVSKREQRVVCLRGIPTAAEYAKSDSDTELRRADPDKKSKIAPQKARQGGFALRA
ncbi:MAG: hypothetical protein MZU95_16425 [Desulfomicrobium escambiense]|nr:hypothetical protein [Desulfomicrobium escambiense]